MLKAFINIFRIPELRNKFLFTLAMLCIYRVGFHVPLPGVDQEKVAAYFENLAKGDQSGAAGRLIQYVGIFTGGNLSQSTLFGLGIMPYISAGIIFQLLATVVPALEKLQKEGEVGRQKINEYTRYATVGLCLLQAVIYLGVLTGRQDLVMPGYGAKASFWIMGLLGLTAGTIFMMWLGEQIDHYGIGNGVSLIIMAGIVAQLPGAIGTMATMLRTGTQHGWGSVVFLLASFLFVVAGAILITQGQRRIPIQQAKMTRGRRVYGGQRQYLPLRVNHGGVMPIIFASTLLLVPSFLFGGLKSWTANVPGLGDVVGALEEQFRAGSFIYEIAYVALIFLFAYFWTTVQFRPKEMANQLRDYGSFIPGLRPGKRTADYLEQVMGRITYVGAAFLAVIAVIPSVVATSLEIPWNVSSFLGGTGLLIMVSVALDMIQRIEANLIMRNYGGFLGDKKTKIKGAYA